MKKQQRRRLQGAGSFGAAVLATLAIVGCADTDFEGECTVSALPNGAMEVRCPDGQQTIVNDVVPDGTCRVTMLPNGGKSLDCPDGSKLELPPVVAGNECKKTKDASGNTLLTCGSTTVVLAEGCANGFPGSVHVGSEHEQNGETSGRSLVALFLNSGCDAVQGDVFVMVDEEHGQTPGTRAAFQLRHIGGSLDVYANMDGAVRFPNLTSVGGNARLSAGSLTTEFDLPKLASVGASLELQGGESWATIRFPALTTLEELHILWFDALEDLQIVQQVPGLKTLRVDSVSGIRTFPSLAALTQLRTLEVRSMYDLETFEGGVSVTAMDEMTFGSLHALTAWPQFSTLTTLGSLMFSDMGSIETLPNFPVLETIERELRVAEWSGLRWLTGLNALKRVGESIMIGGAPTIDPCAIRVFYDGLAIANGLPTDLMPALDQLPNCEP